MDKFDIFVKETVAIIKPSEEQIKDSIKSIREYTKNEVEKSNLKSLVIGISGGLDSAVVAAIVKPVCEELNIKLMGVSIPLSSSKDHKEKAKYIGEKYCDSFMEMNSWDNEYNPIYKQVIEAVSETDIVAEKAGFKKSSFNNNIAQGNIKARLRMVSLYRLAGVTNGAVLSTDNYSEYFLGFWTICGDVGDISPIQFVEKGTEEIEMAKYLKIREDIITQEPSDGLNTQCVGDCDEDQLGMSYKEIGPVIFAYENRLPEKFQNMFEEIKNIPKVKNIIERHNRTEYKRRGPFFVTRSMNNLSYSF